MMLMISMRIPEPSWQMLKFFYYVLLTLPTQMKSFVTFTEDVKKLILFTFEYEDEQGQISRLIVNRVKEKDFLVEDIQLITNCCRSMAL